MKSVSDHTIETAIATVGSKATYTGAGITVGGWYLSSEFALVFGMLLGLAGFIVNWYYKHKLTQAEIALRTEELRILKESVGKDTKPCPYDSYS